MPLYKTTYTFCIFVWLSLFTVHAQSNVVDSLERILQDELPISQRIQVYNKLAEHFIHTDSSRVIKYANQALVLAKKTNRMLEQVTAYGHLGTMYMLRKQYNVALNLFKKMLVVAKKSKHLRGQMVAYSRIGQVYSILEGKQQAFKYFEKSLSLSEVLLRETFRVVDDTQKEENIIQLGILYKRLVWEYSTYFYYDQALVLCNKLLSLADKFQNREFLADAYQIFGNIKRRQSKPAEALRYLLKSVKIYKSLGKLAQESWIYNLIGLVYTQLDLLKQAESYYKKSEITIRKAEKQFSKSNQNLVITIDNQKHHLYEDLATLYYKAKNYDLVFEYAKKSEKSRSFQISWTVALRAAAYNQLGQHKKALKMLTDFIAQAKQQKRMYTVNYFSPYLAQTLIKLRKYTEAERILIRALNLNEKKKINREQLMVFLELSQLYERQKRFKKSLFYKNKYIKLKKKLDLVNNQQQAEAIRIGVTSEHNAQINKELLRHKKLEIENHQIRIRQHTTLLIVSVLALLLILMALFFVIRSRQSQIKFNEVLASKNEELLSLDRFKQQMLGMIIHDLKNPLNSIIGLSDEQESSKVQLINQAGRQMQILVGNILDVQKMQDDKMTLQKEIVTVDNILQAASKQVTFFAKDKNLNIELVPTNSHVQVNIDVDLITRVLVNLLTNAIKYTPQFGQIQIGLNILSSKYCKIYVQDTGIGIAVDQVDKVFEQFQQAKPTSMGYLRSTGLGLTFCKLVIETHQGRIGVFSEQGKGSTFWFTLPLTNISNSLPLKEQLVKTITDSNGLALTNEEQILLKPFAQQIAQYQLYETTKIKQTLESIQFANHPQIQVWVAEVEDSLFAYSEVRYQALIAMVILVLSKENSD